MIVPTWLAFTLGVVAGVAIYRGIRTGSIKKAFNDSFTDVNKKSRDSHSQL